MCIGSGRLEVCTSIGVGGSGFLCIVVGEGSGVLSAGGGTFFCDDERVLSGGVWEREEVGMVDCVASELFLGGSSVLEEGEVSDGHGLVSK